MKRALAVGAAVLALVGLAACGDEAAAPPAVPRLYDLDHDPLAGVTVDTTVAVPADRLRLVVEDLFEWHSISLTGALRTTAQPGPGQTGWVDQLAVNSDELSQAIALVYGPDGAKAFGQQWAQHTQFLVDYAAARQRGDEAAATTARANLEAYERDAGALLGQATEGRVPADAATSLLREHVERMLASIDALVAGDPARATTLVLEDHGYLNGVAGALAGAFADQFPARFGGKLDTAYAEYCSLARRAVGAFTIGALGTTDPATPSLVTLGRGVAEAFGPAGAGWDPGVELVARWQAVTDAEARPAEVKRSLADAAATIDGWAPDAG